jgi:hypothetical protein
MRQRDMGRSVKNSFGQEARIHYAESANVASVNIQNLTKALKSSVFELSRGHFQFELSRSDITCISNAENPSSSTRDFNHIQAAPLQGFLSVRPRLERVTWDLSAESQAHLTLPRTELLDRHFSE